MSTAEVSRLPRRSGGIEVRQGDDGMELVGSHERHLVNETALALWQLSFPIGTMLGFLAGGWLSTSVGWRQAFLILGAAGEPINSEAGARAVSPPHCPCGHR